MRDCKYNRNSIEIISLILAVILVYGHCLSYDFLKGWDDGWMVFNDYTCRFTWENTVAIFTEFYRGQYSPLNQFVYTVLHRLAGYNSMFFHLVSLILHTGCTLFVWSIVKYFSNRRIAWSVAILFAVHPLQVESVVWISASKILWYAFFYLLALRLYIRYAETQSAGYYIGVLICFILSFGGKEQAVTLPVCLLLFDGMLKRDFKNSLLWREKIPFFILAFFFSYITLLSHASNGLGMLTSQQTYPFYQRIAFGAYAYTEYIVKTLVPVNLLYLYPFPMRIGDPLPLQFWLYPVGWSIMIFVFLQFWKKRPVLLGMIYYTILISLTIQIVPMARNAIVADRYIYLASPGLFFVMVYYIDLWIQRNQRWKMLSYGGMLAYILVLGSYAYYRTYTWESNRSLKGKLIELLERREATYKPTAKYE